MKKKNILVLAGSLALVAVIGVGSTLAYFTDSDSATNVVTMGNVNIDLVETDGTDTSQTGLEYTGIVPGDKLTKKATINVDKNSKDCYVRVKIEVTAAEGANEDFEANVESADFLKKQLNIDTDSWYHSSSNGYYYYQEVLKAGDSIDIFDTVTIPTSWGNEAADQSFDIAITVEAIQADNFTPTKNDNGKIRSWGNVDIDKYTGDVAAEPTEETTEEETVETPAETTTSVQ